MIPDRGQDKLQALLYDILPWRKVPESGAWSVGPDITFPASFGVRERKKKIK